MAANKFSIEIGLDEGVWTIDSAFPLFSIEGVAAYSMSDGEKEITIKQIDFIDNFPRVNKRHSIYLANMNFSFFDVWYDILYDHFEELYHGEPETYGVDSYNDL